MKLHARLIRIPYDIVTPRDKKIAHLKNLILLQFVHLYIYIFFYVTQSINIENKKKEIYCLNIFKYNN